VTSVKKYQESFFLTIGTLAVLSAIVLGIGDSPISVASVLLNSAFGSLENFSYTLFYSTPILLTACSVRLALAAGLFNIGAEGQMLIGALASVAFGLWFGPTLPVFVVIPSAIVFAMAAAAFWAGIAGWLRVRHGIHEVISTILLNFVALALVNWSVLEIFKNPENQSLETTWIAEGLRFGPLWKHATVFAPLAIGLAVLVHAVLTTTWFGLRVRSTGHNPRASELAGIAATKIRLKSLLIAGAIAGLAGVNEVFGHAYRLIDGFSPGYGFIGLSVALIARGSLPMLIAATLLFGALQKGALDLDLETERVTRDLAAVIQAVILLVLALQTRKKGGASS